MKEWILDEDLHALLRGMGTGYGARRTKGCRAESCDQKFVSGRPISIRYSSSPVKPTSTGKSVTSRRLDRMNVAPPVRLANIVRQFADCVDSWIYLLVVEMDRMSYANRTRMSASLDAPIQIDANLKTSLSFQLLVRDRYLTGTSCRLSFLNSFPKFLTPPSRATWYLSCQIDGMPD